jgi:hypothetical protein
MTENTDPTNTNDPDESGWADCPNGEISRMVERVAHQRKLATAGKVSAIAGMLLLGIGVWLFSPPSVQNAATPEGEYDFGSICCSEVIDYAAAFHKGELNGEKTAQISQHIATCPHCGPVFEKMAAEPHAAYQRTDQPSRSAVLADSLTLVSR